MEELWEDFYDTFYIMDSRDPVELIPSDHYTDMLSEAVLWPKTEATSVVAPFKVYTHDENKGTPSELTEVATELHGRFTPGTGQTATSAIPLSPTQGSAGGGVGISAVKSTVQDPQDALPSTRTKNKEKGDAIRLAKENAAKAQREKAIASRDLSCRCSCHRGERSSHARPSHQRRK